jgi:hypothetical protein
LVTETIEVARDVVNMTAGTLLKQRFDAPAAKRMAIVE